jgi:hypothetical protein
MPLADAIADMLKDDARHRECIGNAAMRPRLLFELGLLDLMLADPGSIRDDADKLAAARERSRELEFRLALGV